MELSVIVEGIPPPSITWLKDGQTLIGQATVNVIDNERTHHGLVLENIKVIDLERLTISCRLWCILFKRQLLVWYLVYLFDTLQ